MVLRKLRPRRRVVTDTFCFEYLIVSAEGRSCSLILEFSLASIESFRCEELEIRCVIECAVALEQFIDCNVDIALDCAE